MTEVTNTRTPGVHIRSPIARAMYSRMMEDRDHQNSDHSDWYFVNHNSLPQEICDRFIQFEEDAETKEFLDKCYEKSDWLFTQLYHLMFKAVLRWFMSQTSINGFLQRGSMFVFSHDQFISLMDVEDEWRAENLLDLGAGDGMVTEVMARHFNTVYTTEASTTMIWRLEEKGYRNLDIEKWHNNGVQYDLISCLNLLDRCDKPVTLLYDMKKVLRPGTGRIIVAVVLPFRPYVEYSGTYQNKKWLRSHLEYIKSIGLQQPQHLQTRNFI